jgi:hypothetical protein
MRPRFLALVLLVFSSRFCSAIDNEWTNAAGTFTWSTGTNNWAIVPWSNEPADTAIFGSTGIGMIAVSGVV